VGLFAGSATECSSSSVDSSVANTPDTDESPPDVSLYIASLPVADPGFASGGGADRGERGTQAYNKGLWAEPPAGSRGGAHSEESGANTPSLLSVFSYKSGQKFKNLTNPRHGAVFIGVLYLARYYF